MPKEPKAPAKHVYVKFTEPEDLKLLEHLEKQAKAERREMGLYILLRLHQVTQLQLQAPATK